MPEEKNKLPGFLQSSVNPAKISLTLKALVPLLVFILPLLGFVDITPENLNSVIDGIINAIVGIGSAISGVLFVYGLIRKFFVVKK